MQIPFSSFSFSAIATKIDTRSCITCTINKIYNSLKIKFFFKIHMGGELYKVAIEVAGRCKNVALVGS